MIGNPVNTMSNSTASTGGNVATRSASLSPLASGFLSSGVQAAGNVINTLVSQAFAPKNAQRQYL